MKMIGRKAHAKKALYSCADKECAEIISYPPDMLWWCAKCLDFFCEYHECFDMNDVMPGMSLYNAIAMQSSIDQASVAAAPSPEPEREA